MEYEINGDFLNISLECWDTAGETLNRRITRHHYERVYAAIFFYDMTDSESLQNLQDNWIPEFKACCKETCVFF
jgi:GTPase SAR1 family protein